MMDRHEGERMETELSAQWAKLLAAGYVRWMPGMLTADGERIISASYHISPMGGTHRGSDWGTWVAIMGSLYPETCGGPGDKNPGVPGFTDAGTLGCLLAQVREAYGCPHITVSYDSDTVGGEPEWATTCDYAPDGAAWLVLYDLPRCHTEAGALLAALEARCTVRRGKGRTDV